MPVLLRYLLFLLIGFCPLHRLSANTLDKEEYLRSIEVAYAEIHDEKIELGRHFFSPICILSSDNAYQAIQVIELFLELFEALNLPKLRIKYRDDIKSCGNYAPRIIRVSSRGHVAMQEDLTYIDEHLAEISNPDLFIDDKFSGLAYSIFSNSGELFQYVFIDSSERTYFNITIEELNHLFSFGGDVPLTDTASRKGYFSQLHEPAYIEEDIAYPRGLCELDVMIFELFARYHSKIKTVDDLLLYMDDNFNEIRTASSKIYEDLRFAKIMDSNCLIYGSQL